MKNPIKKIKQWISGILTVLVAGTLFGIIFIETELVQPTPDFFIELVTVLSLTFMMKLWWYDFAEDKRLNEQDIKDEKEKYFKIVDDNIEDSNELEKYLKILNQENKDHYIHNKIGSRTPQNMAKKNWWICLWHPSYKKLTAEQIGQVRFNKLYFKCQRMADKLRPIKSEEIMALSESEMLYDSKNYTKQHKRTYQTVTTILSFVLTTILASLMLKELMLNWVNVFRYVSYLCTMAFTVGWTIMKAYRQTGDDTLDHLSRLKFIIDKFVTYKEKEC